MPSHEPLSPTYTLRGFRRRLASIDSVVQFAILGVLSGLITGVVILAFRVLIEWPLVFFLPDSNYENFEGLSRLSHFLLPVTGALLIGLVFALLKSDKRNVGVAHVLERLARHQGHLSLRNFLVQFVCGALALVSGQSSGREGPAIHLGAASSSLMGRALELPNNSIRVLVGCGAAAAISASFNTPIAGVIFSMEVIMMEYTIAGFIPVILAAVTATLINQMVYGSLPAFDIPPVAMKTLLDVPYVIAEGLVIGVLAAAFIYCVKQVHKHAPEQTWVRLTLAGAITGLCAIVAPEILGVGYDTVNSALLGEIGFVMLLTICFLKLVASAASVGLGIPAGLIGPTLFIGAAAGGLLGMIGSQLSPAHAANDGFYVLLGMGAMMGAVLQAPLAALLAIVELTHNPTMVVPAMLVIVVANLTASQIFGCRSLFLTQMDLLGMEFRQNPLTQALNRSSVASIMERDFERMPRIAPVDVARQVASANPRWILAIGQERPEFILRTEDLRKYLDDLTEDVEDIDLGAIPAIRKDVTSIFLQATLQEALEALNNSGVEALYVNRISAPLVDSVAGIVTRQDIESQYMV